MTELCDLCVQFVVFLINVALSMFLFYLVIDDIQESVHCLRNDSVL
jgi:hypothetical protein